MSNLTTTLPSKSSSSSPNLNASFNPSTEGNLLSYTTTTTTTTNNNTSNTKSLTLTYSTTYSPLPTHRRSFVANTYPLFVALQTIGHGIGDGTDEDGDVGMRGGINGNGNGGGGGVGGFGNSIVPPTQQIRYFNRLSGLYRDKLCDFMRGLEGESPDLPLQASIHTILHLAETVYLPFDGSGEGVVGEEILDWVNRAEIAPTQEESLELAELARPWEHPHFWRYINRCILRLLLANASSLLSTLSTHPSPTIKHLSLRFVELLETFPRTEEFRVPFSDDEEEDEEDDDDDEGDERNGVGGVFEKIKRSNRKGKGTKTKTKTTTATTKKGWGEYVSAMRVWRRKTTALVAGLEAEFDRFTISEDISPTDSNGGAESDARYSFEAEFQVLGGLLLGEESRIMEAADGWKEALGAWGVLVRTDVRRDDLPEIMEAVERYQPVDSTSIVDVILSSLIKGEVTKALMKCQELDTWLVCHLTDLLEKVGAVEDDPKFPYTLRDWFLFEYVELLQTDPGLWRIAADYLIRSSNEKEGRARVSQFLTEVVKIWVGEEDRKMIKERKKGKKKGKGKKDKKGKGRADGGGGDVSMDAVSDDDETIHGDDDDDDDEERKREKGYENMSPEAVLKFCMEFEMEEEAKTICIYLSEYFLRTQNYGLAVAYCYRADDAKRMSRIADRLLDEYAESGHAEFARLVDQIPPSLLHPTAGGHNDSDDFFDEGSSASLAGLGLSAMALSSALSSRLSFLARYRDFHALYARGLKIEAGELLIGLLTSRTAPKRFWAIMLVDCLGLLEDAQAIISTSQTYELLLCLEEIVSPILFTPDHTDHEGNLTLLCKIGSQSAVILPSSDPKSKSKSEEQPVEKSRSEALSTDDALKRLDVVRHAAARNLARTFAMG